MGFCANYIKNLCSIAIGREAIAPLLFSYYITHRCNLNCHYCCDGDGKRFKEEQVPELSTEEAKELISLIADATDTLDITGGEPLVRDDLEEILEFSQKAGLLTILNTKGIGLEARPDIIRFSDVIVLSLDTLDKSELSEIIGRPSQTAGKILSALDFAISETKKSNTKLVLSCVAAPDNLDAVERVLDFAVKNRLGFHISPEIQGIKVNPKLKNNERYLKLMDRVIAGKKENKGILGVTKYLTGIRKFEEFSCHPLLMPTIRPDGKMYYPCLESKNAEMELLNAESYRKVLLQTIKEKGKIKDCKECCHIFCHMAISLFQRSPIAAIGESNHWRNI